MSGMKDKAAIAGIGQTAFGKQVPGTEKELASRAVLAALDDAGLTPDDVDGLCSYTMESTEEMELARTIGLGDLTFFSQIGYGGGAGCATIGHAAMAVATGQADVVVAWRSRKRGGGASTRPWATRVGRLPAPLQFTRPFGLLRPVDEIAMLTRRYMHDYGATREHLAAVAVNCRAYANRNPAAVMGDKPMTVDDYMAARWISEPLCLFDNCLETDGALAAVVVSAERARDLPQPPVLVHAFGQGLPRQHQTMTNYFNEDPLLGPSYSCAAALWRHADVTPADVDVAQLYDAFTPLIPLSWEGYGFCGRGDGKDFTGVPYNTSGGGLSEAYVHGFNLIVEGVRQLRGTSTSQVENARTCLVTSGEGVPTSALLLRAA
jgi:acetyl-CoA acetyltransferase